MFNMDLVGSLLAVLSLVMCVVAIATLAYYKFYRSFNYRLILYLLISFFLDAVTSCLVLLLAWNYYYHLPGVSSSTKTAKLPFTEEPVCIAMYVVKVYCMWNMQMFTMFMIAEVFSMAIFSVELQKVEVPLALACFVLPIAAPISSAYYERRHLSSCLSMTEENSTAAPVTNSAHPFVWYCVIPGMVITSICAIAIATAISRLAYGSLRCCDSSSSNGNSEEESLLTHEYAVRRKYQYRNALREMLPFTLYPIVAQLVLLLLYLAVMLCNLEVEYMFAFTDVSMGSVASIIFFIHIKTLGRRKRNLFRNRSRTRTTSNRVKPINEGDKFVPVGSITATNVTDFNPCGESDVEIDAP